MSSEPVHVTNYLDAADTRSSLDAVRALGALVEERAERLIIRGPGLRAATPGVAIDVGNAGTLLRLLPGWLAGQDGGSWTLDGDESIRRRPVDRVARAARRDGRRGCARARTASRRSRSTGRRLRGIEYALPVASAQIKSCVLLAGLLAEGTTTVVEPEPSRDHTERLLARAGAGIARDGDRVTVTCQDELELDAIHVPGDPSSAAFHVAAAVLVPGSRLVVEGMAANWTRVGFFRILERMGAVVIGDLEERAAAAPDAEPLCELDVAHGPLVGTRVTAERGPAGDRRAPARRAARLLRRGRDRRRGRPGAAAEGVRPDRRRWSTACAASGRTSRRPRTASRSAARAACAAGAIASHGDHRLAMLGAVAGLASREGVEVAGMEAAAVSYPGFTADLATLT